MARAIRLLVLVGFWGAVVAWLGNAIGWWSVLYGSIFLAAILYVAFRAGGPRK